MAYLKGIDLSKWQTTTPSLSDFDFVIARASIGTTADGMYAKHITKARAAGAVTGAYHFNWDPDYSGTATPREQARFFVKAAGDVDLLFLDVEGKMAFEDAESTAFIDEVHKLGKKVGLYMSASVFRKDGQDYDWIAKWSSTPPTWAGWDFWQYTSSGSVAGYTGRLDLNRFNGDRARLLSLSNRNIDVIPKSITATTPATCDVKSGTDLFDLDGKTKVRGLTVDLPGRYSPYGVGTQRAIFATVDGVVRTVLVTPVAGTIKPIVDTTPYDQAALDAAKAELVGENAVLTSQIEALKSAVTNAAVVERERLASMEAERIKAL